jgi:hypothetical protein
MSRKRERGVAWDDDIWWPDSGSLGSVGYLSSEKPADPPVILVPDGKGDYREHVAAPHPKRRLGFI